jgi:hypothetical protein
MDSMHIARSLVVARVVAWMVAVGAVVAVMIGYESLPDTLPVTRWTSAPKSPFIALRVPLINLLTMGLVELLSQGIHRAGRFKNSSEIVTVLLLTAAAKAAVEAAGILWLPASASWSVMPLVAVLIVGLGTAAFLGRELLEPRHWQQIPLTRTETAGAVMLIVGIVVLNLPVLL